MQAAQNNFAGAMRTSSLLQRFPDIDIGTLQDPPSVAHAIRAVLLLPPDTVVAGLMLVPIHETCWP